MLGEGMRLLLRHVRPGELDGLFDRHRLEAALAGAAERHLEFRAHQHIAAHLGRRAAQVRGAAGMELSGRRGAEDAVEKLARQVRLEGLVRLFEGIDVDDEIVHG